MLRRKEKEGWQEGEIHHTLTHHVHMGELTRKRTHSLTHTHTHTHTLSLSLHVCARTWQGLPPTISEEQLTSIFSPHGEIISSRILTENGTPKGVAFVRFDKVCLRVCFIRACTRVCVCVCSPSSLTRSHDGSYFSYSLFSFLSASLHCVCVCVHSALVLNVLLPPSTTPPLWAVLAPSTSSLQTTTGLLTLCVCVSVCLSV